MRSAIQAEGLSKRYRRGSLQKSTLLRDHLSRALRSPWSVFRREKEETFWALKDVSLEVKEGEVLGLIGRRPFKSVVELNKFLLEQKLTPDQAKEFYRKAFVPINLNTGTREEFMLIPGVGARMAAELAEYRPWKTWAQFDKEIGKYVGQQETDRLKQYVFIPPG